MIFGIEHPPDTIFQGTMSTDDLEQEGRRLNIVKQDGFCVSFDGKSFSAPNASISESIARSIVARLKTLLATCMAFDWLCSLPGQPTKDQVLQAKATAQAEALAI